MTNTKISPKVSGAALAGALTALIVWVSSLNGLDVPGEAAVAVTTLITFIVGYFVKDPARIDRDTLNEDFPR